MIENLIRRLASVTSGSRELDLEVAQVLGWTKHIESTTDNHGRCVERVLWMVPSASNVTGKVPDYTTNIHAAYLCAEAIEPGHVGGCTWGQGKGSARIGGHAPIEAATPALALCIAALLAKLAREPVASARQST